MQETKSKSKINLKVDPPSPFVAEVKVVRVEKFDQDFEGFNDAGARAGVDDFGAVGD